jgi:predicted SAM-dependent methyltransferase
MNEAGIPCRERGEESMHAIANDKPHMSKSGPTSIRRLHWGCGPIAPYGWVNSDIQARPGVDVVADIRKGLPFADGEFDYIVSLHALPEIPFSEQDRALRELYRCLRPGGVLRLGLPDLDKAIQAYQSKDIDYFYLIPDEQAATISGKMIVQLTWYGVSRCMFTVEFTTEMLKRAGFTRVEACAYRQTRSEFPGIVELDNRELESFFMEGTK